jgi:pimeloyl-ACP methyl ester carboxylesterase
MFSYRPGPILSAVTAPIVALRAADDEDGSSGRSLLAVQAALAAAGRPPIAVTHFPTAAHNLMRYKPAEVAAAILSLG